MPYRLHRSVAATAAATLSALATAQAVAQAQNTDDTPSKQLGVVTITAQQSSVLPTQIPATMESLTRAQLEASINASDSEDALKYLPSLLVRKRYIGDYNHAILSSRASGTGNSARSAVYADGLLLSNYLGNGVGGLSFPPRWGLVTPEEIERVDVMYGPFSAAFPGNAVGAVVVYTTRMPAAFEAHARVGATHQDFDLYNTHGSFNAWQASATLGDRAGSLAWWVGVNRTHSHGQPLTFATRLVSAGSSTSGTGTPVSGAVAGLNNANQPWWILGAGTEYRTTQDHLKVKLAYDITPTLRASYTLGVWQNASTHRPSSYLRDAAGNPVSSGPIVIDGRSFSGSQALTGGDFALNNEALTHVMHGLSLKSLTRGPFDWEASLGRYDYQRDDKRANAAGNPLPAAASGGAGTLADGRGTGWTNVALRGTWQPAGLPHVLEGGLQQDEYELRYRTSSIGGNWISDAPGALASEVRGHTRLRSLWLQDSWALGAAWKTVLGLRAEQWQAWEGLTAFSASSTISHPARRESHLSPKLALAFQAGEDWVLKASAGRALRFPTVAELYGATSTTNSQYINDPLLKPERSWTGELSAEATLGQGTTRLTLFAENTHDALYSQTLFDSNANRNVSRVQNVGRIATQGLEAAFSGRDVMLRGLDLQASVTYADSVVRDNAGFVATPGDTVGKRQPNIAKWRASAQATYRIDHQWSASLGLRYSGPQYRTLNNADVNGYAYQGVSKFLVADARVVWKADKQWSLAFGVDNLNNDSYWNFHPHPQRSWTAELRFDL